MADRHVAVHGLVLVGIRPKRSGCQHCRSNAGHGVLHPPAPQAHQGSLRIASTIIDRNESLGEPMLGEQHALRCAVPVKDEELDDSIVGPIGVSHP